MAGLGSELAGLATDMAEVLGLSVELDPRDLVLPGVLLVPGLIEYDRLATDPASIELELWLIAGDTNSVTALDELTTMLKLLRANPEYSPSSADPMTVNLASQSPDPLPALRCPLPCTITL